jgi:hypothetical protein
MHEVGEDELARGIARVLAAGAKDPEDAHVAQELLRELHDDPGERKFPDQ